MVYCKDMTGARRDEQVPEKPNMEVEHMQCFAELSPQVRPLSIPTDRRSKRSECSVS